MPTSSMRRIAMPDDGIETLYGSLDENLRNLESALNVRIRTSGNDVVVEGATDEVARAERVLVQLGALLRDGYRFVRGDVKTAAQLIALGQVAQKYRLYSKVTGGQKLHIKVQETIYHPGHYRVALAVNSPTELPRDPEAVTADDVAKGRQSVSAKIQDPPQMPVLADGLFVHTAKVDTPFETDVVLPNITCRK